MKGIAMPGSRRQNIRLLDAVKLDNDVAAARRALKNGADVNTMGGMDRSMLYYAAYHGNMEMVDLLLSYNPDVNVLDEEGFGPLHEAIAKGHLDIAQKLIDAGADIHAQDPYSMLGLTPLHVAFNADLREEKADRVLFLLAAGADEYKRDKAGQTVMDAARARMLQWPFAGEILVLMQEHLASRADKARLAREAEKAAENAAVDQAVHGGLGAALSVRRIRLKSGPKL